MPPAHEVERDGGSRAVWALRGRSIERRLAEIDRRLAELRRARPDNPGKDGAAQLLATAQLRAREAERHLGQSTIWVLQAGQTVESAFLSAARAHDHAAKANERSARAGVGDVAEYRRRAEFHRAAAEAGRQRARADPAPPRARRTSSRHECPSRDLEATAPVSPEDRDAVGPA